MSLVFIQAFVCKLTHEDTMFRLLWKLRHCFCESADVPVFREDGWMKL